MKDGRTNKEILICLEVKLSELRKQFDNHLRHHWAVTLSLITITAGSIATAIISFLC